MDVAVDHINYKDKGSHYGMAVRLTSPRPRRDEDPAFQNLLAPRAFSNSFDTCSSEYSSPTMKNFNLNGKVKHTKSQKSLSSLYTTDHNSNFDKRPSKPRRLQHGRRAYSPSSGISTGEGTDRSKRKNSGKEYWAIQYANDRTGKIKTSHLVVDSSKENSPPKIKLRKTAEEKRVIKSLVSSIAELKSVATKVLNTNAALKDCEEWILSFVLELEQKIHSIILLENRQKQLVEQSRSNGRLNVLDKQGYDELFEGLRSELHSRRFNLLSVIQDLTEILRERIGVHTSEYQHGPISPGSQYSHRSSFSRQSHRHLFANEEPMTMSCIAKYDSLQRKWKVELDRVFKTADKFISLIDDSSTELSNNTSTRSSSFQGGFEDTLPHEHIPSKSSISLGKAISKEQLLEAQRRRYSVASTSATTTTFKSSLDYPDYSYSSQFFRPTSVQSNAVISRSKKGTTVRMQPRSASLPRLEKDEIPEPRKSYKTSSSRRGRSMTRNAHQKNARNRKCLQMSHIKEQLKQAEISHTEKHRRWEDARERVLEAEEKYDAIEREKLILERQVRELERKDLHRELNAQNDIFALQKRIKNLESSGKSEMKDIKDLTETMTDVHAELEAAKKTTDRLEKAKFELQDQLNDATLNLAKERRLTRSLSMDRGRLESELEETKNQKKKEKELLQSKMEKMSKEVNDLSEKFNREKRIANQSKRQSLAAAQEIELLQKQLSQERERAKRMAIEKTELLEAKKKLEINVRSDKMTAEIKETALRRQTEAFQRQLEEKRRENDQTKREYERNLERVIENSQKGMFSKAGSVYHENRSMKSGYSRNDSMNIVDILQQENARLRTENYETKSEIFSLRAKSRQGSMSRTNSGDTRASEDQYYCHLDSSHSNESTRKKSLRSPNTTSTSASEQSSEKGFDFYLDDSNVNKISTMPKPLLFRKSSLKQSAPPSVMSRKSTINLSEKASTVDTRETEKASHKYVSYPDDIEQQANEAMSTQAKRRLLKGQVRFRKASYDRVDM